jgi:hypothetical protein
MMPLLQPTDQGVIAAFEAYYLQKTFAKLIQVTNGENKPTVKEFWKSFNIKHPIDIIDEAWAEVSQFLHEWSMEKIASSFCSLFLRL